MGTLDSNQEVVMDGLTTPQLAELSTSTSYLFEGGPYRD